MVADRRVLIGRKGDESPGLSILPEAYDTLAVGPNGETYKALGYELLVYEDTREPYVAPKRSVPREAPKE
jgi:hypothetical protein